MPNPEGNLQPLLPRFTDTNDGLADVIDSEFSAVDVRANPHQERMAGIFVTLFPTQAALRTFLEDFGFTAIDGVETQLSAGSPTTVVAPRLMRSLIAASVLRL